MGFAIIIFIVLIICVYNANNKILELQKENKRLKQELMFIKQQLQNNSSVEGKDINQVQETKPHYLQEDSVKEKKVLSEEEKKRIALKREKQERETRNTTILITGAVLIVLSAIVFLMSTWYAIPNLLKTSVLILLIAVFLGGSKIAKEKFKLQKTSDTFFYIAMAYIPICLFSISFFGLLGNYLSLFGDGKYIYLTAMGLITAIIYFIVYRQNNSRIIFYGSILSQVFSVILFSLIFDNRLEFISLNLLIYNLLFILLTVKQNNKYIKNVKNIYTIIPYITTFMTCLAFDNQTLLMIINLIMLAVNYLILEIKDKKVVYAYLFNVVLNSLGIYCVCRIANNFTESTNLVLTFVYFVSIYIMQNVILFKKDKRNLKIACSVVTLVMLEMLFLETSFIKTSFLRPYVISTVQCFILLLSYIQSKEKGKKIISYLLPMCFVITGLVLIGEYDFTYHSYILLALITFVLGELLRGKNVLILRNGFFVISNIFITTVYCIIFIEKYTAFSNDVLYFLLLLVVYAYGYLRENKSIFKYLAYITSYIAMISVCMFFNISEDFIYLIPTIVLLVLLNVENKIKILKDNCSQLFFSISKIIAYVYLTILSNEIGTIISLGLTAYFIYYNNKNKESLYFNIIPLIGTMPNIFDNSLDPTVKLCIMLFATIGLTIVGLKDKRINIYIIFSGIYLLFTLEEINAEYINEILFIIWSCCNWYFVEAQKEKDIFKFLSYVGGLNLYNEFAYELNLTEYTAFNMLGYIVFSIAVIRTILKTYLKKQDIDAIEVLISSLLYIAAITSYTGEYDGMLFGVLIVAILIMSYVKKYGMLFLTSIGAILLNVFLLTRTFWFSIPWWTYLLIIGSVLITFAIKNEANEKKNRLNIGNTLKQIKERIEK